MKITQTIADIKEVTVLMDENFKDNRNKWDHVDNEDEWSAIREGDYYMKNFTGDEWMYYDRPSKAGREDDFIIDALMYAVKDDDFSNYGLVWGFEKYPDALNRFVIDSRHSRASIVAFVKKDSDIIRRSSKKTNSIHTGSDTITGTHENRLVILKLGSRMFFFVNDLTNPVFETDAGFFSWSGNRIGFYTEPGMEVVAKSIKVKKINCEPVKNETFEYLIEQGLNFRN